MVGTFTAAVAAVGCIVYTAPAPLLIWLLPLVLAFSFCNGQIGQLIIKIERHTHNQAISGVPCVVFVFRIVD